MSARLFDTTSGAFRDVDTPRIYDNNSKAWIPSIGRAYDKSSNSWIKVFGGISYSRLVELAGLSPLAYSSLDEVFADQVATRQIFTKHASSDYFAGCCALYNDLVDKFVNSEYAMKWVGLRDYICDKLMAIPDIQQKMLDSVYWEYILKDHVPVMTSNTAPYGTVTVSSTYSTSYGYNVFNENFGWSAQAGGSSQWICYEFVNPIRVRSYYILSSEADRITDWKLQASNDKSTWVDLDTKHSSGTVDNLYKISNNGYYKFYRIYVTGAHRGLYDSGCHINKIQFYGRALNISVPVMTSNTAPWGKVSASSGDSRDYDFSAYKSFDGEYAASTWQTHNNADNAWLQYNFGKYVNVRTIEYIQFYTNDTATAVDGAGLIQISNDGINWETIANVELKASEWKSRKFISVADNEKYAKYVRFQFTSHNKIYNSTNYAILALLQFYGVDYSEREFEEGSTMKYIYDHGVELEELDYTSYNIDSEYSDNNSWINNGSNLLETTQTMAKAQESSVGTNKKVDLSDFKLFRYTYGYSNIALEDRSADISSINALCNIVLTKMRTLTEGFVCGLYISEKGKAEGTIDATFHVRIYDAQSVDTVMSCSEMWLE